MVLETAIVQAHEQLSNDCRMLNLESPEIAQSIKPGQFVHLRVPNLENAVLRRPFSVFNAEARSISIMYKRIGIGTRAMAALRPGYEASIIGPLGNGFPQVNPGSFPVLAAGGYGIAALHLLARRSSRKGIIFIGASCADNIICVEEFQRSGWTTRTATEDGSAGRHGLIVEDIDNWLADEQPGGALEFFACGPAAMLKAIADRAISGGWKAWLSMERHMGCGVGACLGCAQKVKAHQSVSGAGKCETQEHRQWKWARVCVDGPVFECRDIEWELVDGR